MLPALFAAALLAAPPLPELHTGATDAGSVFHVRNPAGQPVKAYLIELVNYPGSFYMLWQDELAAAPLPAGAETRIPVTNMTVGAAPEYMRLQAALYADGATAGVPDKVAQLLERRRHVLGVVRELIGRLESSPAANSAGLRQWAESIPLPTRATRATQAGINDAAARGLILDSASKLETGPPAAELTRLRGLEKALRN